MFMVKKKKKRKKIPEHVETWKEQNEIIHKALTIVNILEYFSRRFLSVNMHTCVINNLELHHLSGV